MTASAHPAESQIAAPFAAALGDFNEALTLVDPETEPGFYGVVLHDIADVYKAAGEQEKAAAAYQDAISHKQRADNPSDLATTMIVYSDFLIDHNDLTEARSILDQTSQLLTDKAGDVAPARLASRLSEVGRAYERLGTRNQEGAYDQALITYQRTLTLVDPETEPGFYGVVLHDIADVYKAAGEQEKAAAAYQDAISHKQRADNPSDLATTMIVYSDFLIDHNDLTEARSILDQTSQLLTKSMGTIKPAAMAVYFYDLGSSYENLGGEGHDDAYTEALAAYDTARQLLDPAADPGSYATVMKHIAGVHQAQGRLTEAVAACQEAVDRMRHVSGASSSVASLLVDLGRLRRKIAQLGVKNA